MGIDDTGLLWTWGSNGNGQIGDGTTTQRNSPVNIPLNGIAVKIGAGGSHSLGCSYKFTSQHVYKKYKDVKLPYVKDVWKNPEFDLS